MKLTAISFENYKAFFEKQTIGIKPITILIGKNSSGKSSVAKLFTLLENSLSEKFDEPLHFINNDVVLGGDFRDLVYNRQPSIPISFSLEYGNGQAIKLSVIKQNETNPTISIYSWSYDGFSVELTKDHNVYQDASGNKFTMEFKGFNPISIISESGEDILPDLDFKRITMDVDYIGPFRILPKRIFNLTGQMQFDKTGVKGENAYSMLGVSKLLNDDLHKDVSKWYESHFDGWKLEVTNKSDPYIEITLNKSESEVNIVDVGQGMNQVLPLVVRSFTKKENSIVVLEQPELHLHPAAHGDLVELFAKSAKENNQSFIIETHSENIVLRLRFLAVSNNFGFSKDDIAIYWINQADAGGQRIESITIDDEGMLSDWPEGVFTENISEIEAIRKAVKNKKG